MILWHFIKYEQVFKVTNQSNEDWKKLFQAKSDGLTRTGQLLLQIAVESYVYAVLGAQARTRRQIIVRGAKS